MNTPASFTGAPSVLVTANCTEGEMKSINTELLEVCGAPVVNQQLFFRHSIVEGQVQSDPRNNVHFADKVDIQLGLSLMPHSITMKGLMGSWKDFSNKLTFGESKLSSYENAKEPQPALSSNMVFRPLGVPDGTLDSIHCTIDPSFKSRDTWTPQPLLHRVRTYTKVYKSGAVARSVDVTRYSGYQELKQDLARFFGIEGQLEGPSEIGWEFLYIDHDNDVLILGDDPWEEFVSCACVIKILCPQEVQQLSLDGYSGNSILQNQACSNSDGIFSLAYSSNGQNAVVAGSRYMDTVTGIMDLTPARQISSKGPNFQVGCRLKRPRQPGMPDEDSSLPDNLFKRTTPWLGDDFGWNDQQGFHGLSFQRIEVPPNPSLANSKQPNYFHAFNMPFVQNLAAADHSHRLGLPAPQFSQRNTLHFDAQCTAAPLQFFQREKSPPISLSSVNQPQHELSSTSSSNISRFRKLLRKMTYKIEFTSNNQTELSSHNSQDGEVQSHPRDEDSFGDETDIQLGLSMMPRSLAMKE